MRNVLLSAASLALVSLSAATPAIASPSKKALSQAADTAQESSTTAVSDKAVSDKAVSLVIEVGGIKKPTGQLLIAIFDSAESYGGEGDPVASVAVPVDADMESLEVELPKSGTYGFRMFHDIDGDGAMDTNPLGMPTEPFAFSNNARASMGPAPFSAVQFDVDGSATQSVRFR
ncbi:MAG: DUF2141 domain-containing protein [Pseudomonadota bacterium]